MNAPSAVKKTPSAPPAYRPQPLPKVLQTKPGPAQQRSLDQSSRHPIAPPIFRPVSKKIVQPAIKSVGPTHKQHDVRPAGRGQADSIQRKQSPNFAGRSSVIMLASEPPEKKSKRSPRLTKEQMDQAKLALSNEWKSKIKAGTLDVSIKKLGAGADEKSKVQKSCSARIVYTRMDDQETEDIEGAFNSNAFHAEMDALTNFYRENLEKIRLATLRIEIETQPCTRCAVVLNKLNLSRFVFYKKIGGFIDYPTWRFPDIEVIWSDQLGISEHAVHEADKQELKNFFATNKWWV